MYIELAMEKIFAMHCHGYCMGKIFSISFFTTHEKHDIPIGNLLFDKIFKALSQ